jgi:hypothetical protein
MYLAYVLRRDWLCVQGNQKFEGKFTEIEVEVELLSKLIDDESFRFPPRTTHNLINPPSPQNLFLSTKISTTPSQPTTTQAIDVQ